MLHAVIMAGGAGTRFWPASRQLMPKQLLRLVGERTMLQSTVDRLEGLVPAGHCMVVTSASLAAPVRGQLPALPAGQIVGEPCKRDTAPAIALAAALIAMDDPEAVMLVLPSDHVIAPVEAFQSAIRAAVTIVEQNPESLVTFGIRPTYAAEVFGYIERDETRPVGAGLPAWQVRRFREKPDAATAAEFLRTGGFYWNAGIFVWRAATILAALEAFEPEIARPIRELVQLRGSPGFDKAFADCYAKLKGKSIDYAVLERHPDVCVIEAPFQWDDLGSWQSLARLRGVDGEGNTVDARHLGLRTSRCIVRGPDDHLIVTLGTSDLIVVHTPDATLVANRHDEAAVKEIVAALDSMGWRDCL
jgi:mannose-1-phosphate guanylyltransferase